MIRIALVLVAVSLAAACQDTVPQASGGSQKMQLEQNKTIARAYLHELVNANDVAAAERYLPPSATFNGSTITGQQAERRHASHPQSISRLPTDDRRSDCRRR